MCSVRTGKQDAPSDAMSMAWFRIVTRNTAHACRVKRHASYQHILFHQSCIARGILPARTRHHALEYAAQVEQHARDVHTAGIEFRSQCTTVLVIGNVDARFQTSRHLCQHFDKQARKAHFDQ